MERRDDEAPFPREPWQRMLGESADGPPETTDARIRAAARRDLAPRGRRWWLPASLAASFLLAVMIVRSEFGTLQRPLRIESDVTGDSAIDARLIERGAGPEAREAGKSPAAASRAAPAHQQAEPDDYGYDDAESGTEAAGVGPRVGGPEHELRAASELPGEAVTSEDTRVDLQRREEALESESVTGSMPASAADESTPAAAPPRTPEDWYAQVRKLIAEGRRAEAERELEALRKAHPDWAAKNVKAADLR